MESNLEFIDDYYGIETLEPRLKSQPYWSACLSVFAAAGCFFS